MPPRLMYGTKRILFLALLALVVACAPAARDEQASGSLSTTGADRDLKNNASAVSASPETHSTPARSRESSGPGATAPRDANAPRRVSQVPGPSATPAAPAVLELKPESAPVITAYKLSSTTVHPGDAVIGEVFTSSNVASVEARIAGYSLGLNKVGIGRFEFVAGVPNIPWFVAHSYTLELIARNARGDATKQSVPINIR